MPSKEIEREIARLRRELNRHNYLRIQHARRVALLGDDSRRGDDQLRVRQRR